MPPKAKKPDGKRSEGPVEDETGIPKNEVGFKFSFQVKQNEVENILIMFEWINQSDLSLREKVDTELIECWNQVNPEDPTLLNYEIELPFLRVEDKFVKNLCANKFYMHFVSVEDQCIKDSLSLHYSPLLTAKGEQKLEFYFDKIKIPQIESFKVTLTADRELLTPLFKDFLNPLEICIVGAKEMPLNVTDYSKKEPVYVQAKFADGTVIKTHELPYGRSYKWMYKQVILAGLMDPVKLLEHLRTTPLQFEVHDQDEVAKNQIREYKQLGEIKYEEPEPPAETLDPKAKGKGAAAKKREPSADPKKKDDKAKDAKGKDAKGKKDPKKKKDVKTFEPIKNEDTREMIRNNYGMANFNLQDLLNPHLTSVKLRSHVVPVQKYENKDSTNLDLNTTAKRELQGAHISGDYINNESYLVVTFEIAHAIRPFKKPESAQPEPVVNAPAASTKASGKSLPGVKQGAKNAKDQERPDTSKSIPPADLKPVFERAIYIFPYKSPEYTPKLLSIVQEINMAAFQMTGGNPLFITTKALSEEEKNNRELDIVTGVEFIDNQYRTFILEGLADKGMKRLEEEFPKDIPNNKDFKIMKNSDIKFKDRLYVDCNIDVKKIRLRENLAKLLGRPEIYLRSKVPEHIYNILIKFIELRRCDSVKAVVASDLFPDIENIISMERKYGDALTDEDVNGKECPPQKAITRTAAKLSKVGSDLGLSNIQSQMSGRNPTSKSRRLSKELSTSLEKSSDVKDTVFGTKLATKIEQVKTEKYSLHMTKPYPTQTQEVYTSAGTKLNIYEQQKAELREIARNDPNHFYTYSAEYLSLSIDPYAPEDIKKLADDQKKLWKTPQGFQTILKKDKKDYNVHPKKPHESTIDELGTYPWHQDKLEQTSKLKNSRGEPIRNGADFMLRLKTKDIFSLPEIIAEEKMTAVEKERQIQEAKKRVEEDWKKKLIVDNAYFYTSTCVGKNSQLDKIKNIREGDAKKLGLILNDRKLKKTSLGTTKTIDSNPICMYLQEEWQETANKNFFERQLDIKRAVSGYDFKTNIKQSHQYNQIYKPVKEIFPKV